MTWSPVSNSSVSSSATTGSKSSGDNEGRFGRLLRRVIGGGAAIVVVVVSIEKIDAASSQIGDQIRAVRRSRCLPDPGVARSNSRPNDDTTPNDGKREVEGGVKLMEMSSRSIISLSRTTAVNRTTRNRMTSRFDAETNASANKLFYVTLKRDQDQETSYHQLRVNFVLAFAS